MDSDYTTDISVVLDQLEEAFKAVDMDQKLTPQELKFVDLHLRGQIDAKNAMKAAGYKVDTDGGGYMRVARKILLKYEGAEGDKAKIMRILGAGEIAIILGMLDLARNARSEVAKGNAWTTLGKWLGFAKEGPPQTGGVTVIIQALGDAQVQVNQEQAQVEQQQPYSTRPQPTGRPVYVTK